LKALDWQPFESRLDNSLDYSMVNRVKKAAGKVLLVRDDTVRSMSVSCNLWPNKHSFECHWQNRLPSKKIEVDELLTWFPEARQIFN
jgi:hypothetical protein